MNASRPQRVLSLSLILSILLVPVPSARAAAGDTTRVSVVSDGTQGNEGSYHPFISADGNYAAFSSHASNLVSGDTNGQFDIFMHDRVSGATSRISVASGGVQGDGSSDDPFISADGRYVAFQSYASNLVNGDTNANWDVFIYDRVDEVMSRVSVASDGEQGIGGSSEPSVSSDGRYVAFSSTAVNLVSGDTNGAYDVFVRDRVDGVTSRVSVDTDGTQGNGWSLRPSISTNGCCVVFESYANNLVSGDTNGGRDVFVHDLASGVTSRVSVASEGTQGNAESLSPSISADGRYVAFMSHASNLINGDTNIFPDVFVHDRLSGETSRVSVASDGTEGNLDSYFPSISADGRFVAFSSVASNLVSGDTNWNWDVFLHDRLNGVTSRVSTASNGAEGNERSDSPSISADGRYLAFHSLASNLVSGDANDKEDIFVHENDISTGPFSISGDAGASDVTLSYVDGEPKTALSDGSGNYSFTVPYGWSGTVTPSRAGYTFTPAQREYTNVTTDWPDQDYTARTKAYYISSATLDGWILESAETSGKGGSMNATATVFNLGDDAADRQYRGILSFNTSTLPDTAVITKAVLKIKRQGIVGTNPFITHSGLKADIRKPYFGTAVGLAVSDFQAWANLSGAATFNKMPATGAWYSAVLSSTAYPYINRKGTTQFRLRFAKEDNDDRSADYLKFYSGNASAAYRPVLVVEYHVP